MVTWMGYSLLTHVLYSSRHLWSNWKNILSLNTPMHSIPGALGYLFMLLTSGNIPSPAVVCYAADRNELRSRVIQWLQTEIIPDGWFVKGSNFSDILLKYFKVGRINPFLFLCSPLLQNRCFHRIPQFICPRGPLSVRLLLKAAWDCV